MNSYSPLPSEPPLWAARYIGIPFLDHGRDVGGLDCWGLALLVLKLEGKRIGLPDFLTKYAHVKDHALPDVFREQMTQWKCVQNPELFDVAVLRIGGQPRHVGVVVCRNRILTIDRSTASCLERIDGPRWAGRLEGFYRHAS